MSISLDNLEQAMAVMSPSKKEIIEKLNDQQKIAAINYHGPSIVVAAAGSGKTKMIVARSAYMIDDGVNPGNILMFTFTKKAANEIKERVIETIGDIALPVTVSTYHSFCCRQLRKYYELVGLKEKFSIYDDIDKQALIKKIKVKYNHSQELEPREIGSMISYLKEKYLTPEQARKEEEYFNDTWKYVINIYADYQKKLRESNAVDFDDLLFYMVWILENRPEVRNAMQNKYKYICVDEMQDSSNIDCRFIFNLMNPVSMNICLVGDWNQGRVNALA